MSESDRPGGRHWKPSEEEVLASQDAHPGLALRLVSIIPFGLIGAFSVIAIVAWFAVVIFGAGTDRGALWTWAQGKPAGEVLSQVALAIALGLIPVAILVLCTWATMRGFDTEPALYFWLFTEITFTALSLALVAGRVRYPEFMENISLGGQEWWFALALVGFGMTVAHLRVRRDRKALADGMEQADDV